MSQALVPVPFTAKRCARKLHCATTKVLTIVASSVLYTDIFGGMGDSLAHAPLSPPRILTEGLLCQPVE